MTSCWLQRDRRAMKQTIVELIDDIDETPADETVVFALDGINYEIDLSEANAAKLREALAPYVVASRKVGRGSPTPHLRLVRSPATRTAADKERLAAIRMWAQANGFEVKDRGRISAEIVTAYEEAQRTPVEVVELPAVAPRKRTRRKPVDPEFTAAG